MPGIEYAVGSFSALSETIAIGWDCLFPNSLNTFGVEVFLEGTAQPARRAKCRFNQVYYWVLVLVFDFILNLITENFKLKSSHLIPFKIPKIVAGFEPVIIKFQGPGR